MFKGITASVKATGRIARTWHEIEGRVGKSREHLTFWKLIQLHFGVREREQPFNNVGHVYDVCECDALHRLSAFLGNDKLALTFLHVFLSALPLLFKT
ncbi:hypothetical protein EV1_003245 [Malus domestica]